MNIPSDHHSLYFNHNTIYLGYGHVDYGINWVRTYLRATYVKGYLRDYFKSIKTHLSPT